MEMFDPNQPQDFSVQTAEVERQRRMADMLRKRANEGQLPGGQMVGKTYVNPHWAEFLPGLLDKIQAGYAESKAKDAEAGYGKQVGEATEKWTSSLPRATAAVPGRVSYPGPDADPSEPGTSVEMPVPATTPDRGSILKATLAGMKIPGNKDAALLWNKGMGDELTREDTQADRAEQNRLRREQQHTEMEGRLQLARDKMALEERMGIDSNATKMYIADLVAEMKKLGIENTKAIVDMKAGATKPDKPLPDKVISTLRDAQNKADFIKESSQTFKPEYGGLKGLTRTTMGTWVGGNTEAANWWKDYRKNTQLIERHAMFGSALTASEKSAWNAADIQPGMNPKLIAENLAKREALTEKMYDRMRDQYSKGGYKVDDAFPKRGTETETKMDGGKTYIKKDGKWYEQ